MECPVLFSIFLVGCDILVNFFCTMFSIYTWCGMILFFWQVMIKQQFLWNTPCNFKWMNDEHGDNSMMSWGFHDFSVAYFK